MEAEAQRIAAETGLAWISPVASTNSWQARSEMGVNAVLETAWRGDAQSADLRPCRHSRTHGADRARIEDRTSGTAGAHLKENTHGLALHAPCRNGGLPGAIELQVVVL